MAAIGGGLAPLNVWHPGQCILCPPNYAIEQNSSKGKLFKGKSSAGTETETPMCPSLCNTALASSPTTLPQIGEPFPIWEIQPCGFPG